MPANPVSTAQLELTAVDNASAVIRNVSKTVDNLGLSYSKLQGVISGLVGTLSVGMFTNMIAGTLEAMNNMRNLAISTGTTVEALSSLKEVANVSGTSMDTVAGFLERLEKNMVSFARDGTGKAAQAFKELGFSQADVKKGLQDIVPFAQQVAQRMVEMTSGGYEVGLVMELIGKSGAAALPFLIALAEAQDLQAKMSTAQTDEAHRLRAEMVKLESGTDALKQQMATGLLPSLIQIVQTFAGLKGKQGDVTDFFETIGTLAKWAAGVVGSLWMALKNMGDGIGAIAAQAGALMHGDFAGASAIGSARDEQAQKNETAYNALWAGLNEKRAIPAATTPPRPKGGGGPPGAGGSDWTEHDEQMYRARVQAVKELDAAEKEHQKTIEAEDRAFASAMKEFDTFTEHQKQALAQEAQHWKDVIDPMEPYRRQMVEINNLHDQALLTDQQWAAAINVVSQNMNDLNKVSKDSDMTARQFGTTVGSAFERMLSDTTKARDQVKALTMELVKMIEKLLIIKPLEKGLSDLWNESGGSVGGVLSKIFGGGASYVTGGAGAASWTSGDDLPLGSYATGTDYVPRTGLYQLHQGEAVTSAADNAASGGLYMPITISAPGADVGAVARIESSLAQFKRDVVPQVVDAVRRGGSARQFVKR
jgi:hypothetical protein